MNRLPRKKEDFILAVPLIAFVIGRRLYPEIFNAIPKQYLFLSLFVFVLFIVQRTRSGLVCPSCHGSLFRFRARQERQLYPFCPHCGTHLFPELPVNEFYRGQETSFLFIAIVVILGGTFAYFGKEMELPVMEWAGYITVVSAFLFAWGFNRSVRFACKKCFHRKGNNKFCENFGELS